METKGTLDGDNSDLIDIAISSALEKLRALSATVASIAVDEERMWYRNLLLGIIKSALLDYQYLEFGGKQKLVYLVAWSCRNLMELNVITTYVLSSAENALDFRNDGVIDVKEFYELLSKGHKVTHLKYLSELSGAISDSEGPVKGAFEAEFKRATDRGPQTGVADTEAEAYRTRVVELGISGKHPKTSGKIAELISKKEEFQPMFKVCSKIMHRTALSIASTLTAGALDEVIQLLLPTAGNELLAIYQQIERRVASDGLQAQ